MLQTPEASNGIVISGYTLRNQTAVKASRIFRYRYHHAGIGNWGKQRDFQRGLWRYLKAAALPASGTTCQNLFGISYIFRWRSASILVITTGISGPTPRYAIISISGWVDKWR